jgi:hypothetical protein
MPQEASRNVADAGRPRDRVACYARRVGLSDTPPAVEAIQLDLLRKAGTARRAALALNLSRSAIRASRRAIARRHPELDEQGVLLRWAELHYGEELAGRVRRYLASRR